MLFGNASIFCDQIQSKEFRYRLEQIKEQGINEQTYKHFILLDEKVKSFQSIDRITEELNLRSSGIDKYIYPKINDCLEKGKKEKYSAISKKAVKESEFMVNP